MASERGKNNQASGGLKEQNNQDSGKTGGGTPTRRRTFNANRTQNGGINRSTSGRKGGNGFS